jgi:putative tricarboxylic transport membrane protein
MQLNPSQKRQALLSVVILLVGIAMVISARSISSDAGYGGVGANFLPTVVGCGLTVIGLLLLREVFTGGFQQLEQAPASESPYWVGFYWLSAGILINAFSITTIGFTLSCAICFMFAVQGLRRSFLSDEQRQSQAAIVPKKNLIDLLIGMAISWPVYLMFTKLLAINLPSLLSTRWI